MRTDVLNQLRKFDDRQMVLLVKDVNEQFQCLVVIPDVSVGEGKMRRNNGIIRTDIALDGEYEYNISWVYRDFPKFQDSLQKDEVFRLDI